MDPTTYPDDTQIAEWAERYGTTGVKTYDLRHPSNKGCIAVYREMKMSERQVMGRMESVEEEHPGAYDYQRMLASTCLLYPTIDAYPNPAFAAAELFQRVRAHGHAPLSEEEEMVSADGQEGALPRHVVQDMKNARENAYRSFSDPRVTSVYQELIVDMATDPETGVDPVALDYMWRLSPGRLRDLAARLEQANASVRKEALQVLESKRGELEEQQIQAQAQQIKDRYDAPFRAIDATVGEEATPDADEEKEEDDQSAEQLDDTSTTSRRETGEDSDLPPNRPPSPDELQEGIRQAVR